MKQLKRTPTVEGEPKASDLWRTPLALFEALDAEFHFDIDLAADESNHLCPRWLGPGGLAEDALAVRWADFGSVGFLNPPYSTALVTRFLAAAAQHGREMTVVALHPLDTSTKWWEHTRSAFEIRDMPHRCPYLRADGVTRAGAMFCSVVTVFRPQPGILRAQPRRVLWGYRPPKAPKVSKKKPKAVEPSKGPALADRLIAAGDQYQWLRGLLHEAAGAVGASVRRSEA